MFEVNLDHTFANFNGLVFGALILSAFFMIFFEALRKFLDRSM